MSSLGFNLTLDPYRVSVWNRVFRRDGKFPHPNHYVANGLKPKPPIFDVFPEAAAMTSEFIYSHLDHFTVEMIRNELITHIIPGLKKKADDEQVTVDSSKVYFAVLVVNPATKQCPVARRSRKSIKACAVSARASARRARPCLSPAAICMIPVVAATGTVICRSSFFFFIEIL